MTRASNFWTIAFADKALQYIVQEMLDQLGVESLELQTPAIA